MSTEEVDIFLKRVSVDQRAAELPAIKVGGFKKKSAARLAQVSRVRTGLSGRFFFTPKLSRSNQPFVRL